MWLIKWIPWFLLAATLEGIGQLFFKKTANGNQHLSGWSYHVQLLTCRYVYFGIISYLLEMSIWLFLLSNIPLSVAFPLSGLQEMVIILIAALTRWGVHPFPHIPNFQGSSLSSGWDRPPGLSSWPVPPRPVLPRPAGHQRRWKRGRPHEKNDRRVPTILKLDF